jgi:hypothetical protein
MGACNGTKNPKIYNKPSQNQDERVIPSRSAKPAGNKQPEQINIQSSSDTGQQVSNNQKINIENNNQANQTVEQQPVINPEQQNAVKIDSQVTSQLKNTLAPNMYYLKIKSENKEIASDGLPGKKLLISAFDDMKQNLEAAENYHFYTLDEENNRIYLNELSDKNLEEIFPTKHLGKYIEIDALIQIYLDISEDIRSAYANTTQIIGTPKYGDPFEVLTYNFSNKKFSIHQIETESFPVLQSFSEFSGQCNGNNKLYLAGSDKKSENEHSHFVELDLLNLEKQDVMKICPNLIKGREWSSILFIPPKYIFIVGGIGVKSVEIYNTETGLIVNDSVLNQEHSESALIVVNNTYLYVFCGYDYNHDYSKVIERYDLRSRKRVWEVVNLDENMTFKPSFFSVAYGKGNEIILLGPHENEPIKNEKNEVVKNNIINYSFELKDNLNTIKPFPSLQLNDETYVCLQKLFVPVDKTISLLMPAYTSDFCKVLIFNSGNENESETFVIEKNEFEELQDEGINPTFANR